MIPALRNTAIRLWIAAITGIPILLILLPEIETFFPGLNHLMAAVIFIPGLFFLAGYAMNLAGQKQIAALIREAEKWTRAGIYKKGKHCYLKAVRIFDSFLLSPWQRKKTRVRLTASMAGFCLAAQDSSPLFNSAVSDFLLRSPHEEEIALFWLTHIYNRKNPDRLDHEILSRIAHVDVKNPDIPVILADIFLEMNSTDLAARKVYHHLIHHTLALPHHHEAISRLLDREDHPDHQVDLEHEDRLGHEDDFGHENRFNSEKRSASEPEFLYHKKKESHVFNQIKYIFRQTASVAAGIFFLAGSLLRRLNTCISACIGVFREKQKARTALKIISALIISSALIFFMINTIRHLLPEKSSPLREKKQIEIPPPQPFTIQVAAYLKKEHADAYVAGLKGKGLNAYLVKVHGGGKTWFLVRISSFASKKEAAAYGEKLKAEGMIDDFFVDNRET